MRERFPEFIFHDAIPPRYIGRVEAYFARFSVLVLDSDKVVAGGWGVPFDWDGTVLDLPDGYDSTLVRAVDGDEQGRVATAFSFMAAAVATSTDRRGLASLVLTELTRRAVDDGLGRVLAPLRPTWKHRYPMVSMAEYAPQGVGASGSMGRWTIRRRATTSSIVAPARRSMVIEGTVAEWEQWTAMLFPVTGDYVVPEALGLVHIDRARDWGRYVEENLWVRHR